MPEIKDPRLLSRLNAPQPVITAPNPMFPGQLSGQGLNNQGQELTNQEKTATLPYAAPTAAANAQQAATQAQVTAATAPAVIQSKTAGAKKDVVEARSAQANFDSTGGASGEQAKMGSFYTRAQLANSMYAKGGYDQNGDGQPTLGRDALKAVLPDGLVNKYTSSGRQTAETLQREFLASTLRYESGAAISPQEFATQRSIYFPAPGDSPETIATKAQLRQNAIEGLKVGSGPSAPLLDARAQEILTTPGPGQAQLPTDGTVTQKDPALTAKLAALIRMGRPYNEVKALVDQNHGTPIDEQTYLKAVAYAHDPRTKGKVNAEFTRNRPTTALENDAASAKGGYFGGAANGLTLGFLDEIAGGVNALSGGDYTQARDAANANKALVRDAHPTADLAGNITGTTLGMLLGGAGAARAAAAAGVPAGGALVPTLADITVGATSGAGENNNDRLQGALIGGTSALAGNVAGRTVANTLGGLVSPSGGAMRPLYDLGVRPSVGQRIGGVANAAEERLQSIPVVGDAIAGTRQRARDQYQVGLFNDALGEIGHQLPPGLKPGHEPHAFAQQAFSDAYDKAERNMVAAADPQLGQDIGQLQQSVTRLRGSDQQRFNTIWQGAVARRFQGGQLAGPAYKDAMSELSREVAKLSKNPNSAELTDALNEAMGALRGSAVRNSAPEAVAALDAADRGYAKLVRIEDASQRAGGDAATFSPAQYNAAVKSTAGGVRSRGYLAGDALNSDIAALGLRLGDKVPNSASFDRAAWAAGVGGLSVLEPTSLAGFGALGALNAPGVRNAVTGAMAPRGGPALQSLADYIRAQSGRSGQLGSSVAVGLLPRP